MAIERTTFDAAKATFDSPEMRAILIDVDDPVMFDKLLDAWMCGFRAGGKCGVEALGAAMRKELGHD